MVSGRKQGDAREMALFGVLLMLSATQVHAQDYPPAVQAEINETIEACKPSKATLQRNFVTQKDVNGDAISDFILDFSEVTCASGSFFCGSGGCTVTVFASMPDGSFVKAMEVLAGGVDFRRVNGRPAAVLRTRSGNVVAYWNGKEFKMPQAR